MEDNSKEEKNNITNRIENEYKNKKANYITGIASIFSIVIPVIILFIYIISSYNNMVWSVGMKFIIPISVIIGITLLAYIRIQYPDNYGSKQLIKICILIFVIVLMIFGSIYEFNRCLSNCRKMQG